VVRFDPARRTPTPVTTPPRSPDDAAEAVVVAETTTALDGAPKVEILPK